MLAGCTGPGTSQGHGVLKSARQAVDRLLATFLAKGSTGCEGPTWFTASAQFQAHQCDRLAVVLVTGCRLMGRAVPTLIWADTEFHTQQYVVKLQGIRLYQMREAMASINEISVTTKRYGNGETMKRKQSKEARKRPNSLRIKERNTTTETTVRLKRGEATN